MNANRASSRRGRRPSTVREPLHRGRRQDVWAGGVNVVSHYRALGTELGCGRVAVTRSATRVATAQLSARAFLLACVGRAAAPGRPRPCPGQPATFSREPRSDDDGALDGVLRGLDLSQRSGGRGQSHSASGIDVLIGHCA